MRHLRKTCVYLVSLCALLLPAAVEAATCAAQGRYVKAESKDAKGFKQAITLAVGANCGASCHGLVNYTVSYKDKDGGSQSKTANVPFKFSSSAAAASGASSGGGGKATDDTVLGAAACSDAKPCSVVGATVDSVSCFKDGGGKCGVNASYADSSSKDAKGFKQAVNFNLSSSDCGGACHGLVKYSLKWKDKDGVEKTDAKSVSYKLIEGGSASEVEVTDETVLAVTACTDKSPCKVTSATVDKVSCFVDR